MAVSFRLSISRACRSNAAASITIASGLTDKYMTMFSWQPGERKLC